LRAGINSLVVAACATGLATTIGLMAALGLREASLRVGRIVIMLLLIPAMLPTMIYSVAAYFAAARTGLLDSYLGLALAHSTLGIPFVVIICATGLAGIKPSVEQAAQSLGAGWLRRFWRITLPLMLPSVLTAALVAFQTSFDEVIVSLFLAGLERRTLPKAMWQASTQEITPIISAVAVLVLVIIFAIACSVYLLSRIMRRHRNLSTWNASQ
jgi:putative spermidine/putrescine transport system permease protein